MNDSIFLYVDNGPEWIPAAQLGEAVITVKTGLFLIRKTILIFAEKILSEGKASDAKKNNENKR